MSSAAPISSTCSASFAAHVTHTPQIGAQWSRDAPLCETHIRHVQQADHLHDLNRKLLALPAPRDAAVRYSMRLRLYAEWVQQRPQPEDDVGGWCARLTASWHNLALFAAAFRKVALGLDVPPAKRRAAASTCFACTESFDAVHPATGLTDCAHPPLLHAACLRAAFHGRLESGYIARCPVLNCGRPTSLTNGFEMALDANALDALAAGIVRAYRTPRWIACPTPDCLGGTEELFKADGSLQHDCALCEQTVTILGGDLQQAREIILAMIHGMGADVKFPIRPCYHCGTATMRQSGCQQMVCGRDADSPKKLQRSGCGKSWSFSAGIQACETVDGRQGYVPKSGLMLQAGLFEPLEPGYLHADYKKLPHGCKDLQALAEANARRLGWLPAAAKPVKMSWWSYVRHAWMTH